jgi:hypothetical protein
VQCWVCKRQARGYGHTDNRYGINDPRRYPIDWVFCSRRCQDAFHRMYGRWASAQLFEKEVEMIDPSDIELAAMRQCLKAFGGAAGEIGYDKPLGEYSEAQALRVIDAIVSCYTSAMVAHHEESRYPPVDGVPAFGDPMVDSFAELEGELPWDAGKGAAK